MPELDTEDLIGIIQRQPTNPNFLESHRFRLVAHRLPQIVYYVQEMNLPGFSMNTPEVGTPLVKMPFHGDTLSYSDLTISYSVDEDMRNYKEIKRWMDGAAYPSSTSQHHAYLQKHNRIDSDLLLMILSSHHNKNHYVMFRNAFPVSMSDINFSVKGSDVEYPVVSVTFRYMLWEFLDV